MIPMLITGGNLSSRILIPGVGQSKSRFFRNQEKLKEIHIEQDLNKALKDADAVIMAVPHQAYLDLDPDELVKTIGHPAAIIDCFGILIRR